MKIEIKIPSPGESITEVQLSSWFVANGDFVERNQEIAELESDKATLTLTASDTGSIAILVQAGETVSVGSIACTIDVNAVGVSKKPEQKKVDTEKTSNESSGVEVSLLQSKDKVAEQSIKITPVAKEMLKEKGVSMEELLTKMQRIGSKEVEFILNYQDSPQSNSGALKQERTEERVKMSPLRKKLSQRLVQVKNQTAMLTTFNEVNMTEVMRLRNTYKEEFQQKFGAKLGFMSFFTRAAAIALQLHPSINSMIDGEEIIHFTYSDIGIAVQTPKGLMVPVIRDCDKLTLAQTELEIARMAQKARDAKISLDEMSGGTFTITNGGVFGSLLSTPIINPPQAGILGMHAINDRPVAENGQVVIRPMMYIALSYDHRLVDGKDSVGFLVKIKELIENPERMLFDGVDAGKKLILG
ncbi:MAG: 2-oxoglutarate dehydrogenase complex dihydrolipoyllysine-residue succinyltransferase [Salinivirgaceae bacterium]